MKSEIISGMEPGQV